MPFSRSTSLGARANASETRSPARYMSVIRARLRRATAVYLPQASSRARTSSSVSTSGGRRRLGLGRRWARAAAAAKVSPGRSKRSLAAQSLRRGVPSPVCRPRIPLLPLGLPPGEPFAGASRGFVPATKAAPGDGGASIPERQAEVGRRSSTSSFTTRRVDTCSLRGTGEGPPRYVRSALATPTHLLGTFRP
jgi:hypothetical protein